MPTFSKWIVTLNPKVLYRGLFRDLLAKVAKERERERGRSTERNPPGVARAHTERKRERIRKARAAPFVEARYDAIQHARFG